MKITKALVLENGYVIDIPDTLVRYLSLKKIKWKWYDMRQKFWPENKEKTLRFFENLPDGQMIFCHTVFEDFQQLELMIELLHKLRHKNFTFKIMHGCLCDDLIKFLNETESSITPKELESKLEETLTDEECDVIFKQIESFKTEMNKKFEEVLSHHNISWLKNHGEEILLKTIEDIHAQHKD